MILTILILMIVLTIAFWFMDCCSNGDFEWLWGITGFGSLVSLIVTICLIVGVANGSKLDEKIEMYTEENIAIEQKIDATVQNYLEYESKTLTGLKTEGGSAITIVAAYPELASSEIVKSQIEVYTENNKTIRRLKEKQINLSLKKWWLYFGG